MSGSDRSQRAEAEPRIRPQTRVRFLVGLALGTALSTAAVVVFVPPGGSDQGAAPDTPLPTQSRSATEAHTDSGSPVTAELMTIPRTLDLRFRPQIGPRDPLATTTMRLQLVCRVGTRDRATVQGRAEAVWDELAGVCSTETGTWQFRDLLGKDAMQQHADKLRPLLDAHLFSDLRSGGLDAELVHIHVAMATPLQPGPSGAPVVGTATPLPSNPQPMTQQQVEAAIQAATQRARQHLEKTSGQDPANPRKEERDGG